MNLFYTNRLWYTYVQIMKNFLLKNLKIILFLLTIVVTMLIGSLIGIILVYQKGFPNQIKNLEDIKPVVMTTVYNDKGMLIKEFAVEKRNVLRSSEIPDVVKEAFVAAEDKEFYSHWGINFKGVMRAITGIMFGKKKGGGSSITQQLARDLFLTREVSVSRKFNEMLLAIQIERKYSKDQILTFYLNKIFLGASVYGVEAAAQHYFGKSIKDITVSEAALLAAINPNPNRLFNVFTNPENCRVKRNQVLQRMLLLNTIDRKEYEQAIKVELPEEPHETVKESIGDYFLEETRKHLETKYGEILLYQGGLKVYSTLNSEMQKWAETALREGLRELSKRRGWRSNNKLFNLVDNQLDIDKHTLPEWKNLEIEKDAIVNGIVLSVNSRQATVRIDTHAGTLKAADASWTKRSLTRALKKGDVALFKILEIDEKTKKLKLGLEQEPEVQGGILVVENKTGEIKAMVGGYSFEKSKWNNAMQALRQTGSTFKPIVYTAALENGYTPATIIDDEPFAYFDEYQNEIWEPQNEDKVFKGPLTLRRALELSRNACTARIVEQLSPDKIVQYARKFGISSYIKPYMAISLGVFEVTLNEMVAAYTVFPNLGVRVTPFLIRAIRDQNNNLIEENFPDRRQVLEPDTAYLMNYLMRGVVKSGSGWRAKWLKAPIGGKTGTTDDYTDAWFIGFSPSITVGVWVGFDIKKNLGKRETGSKAASPIYVKFMEKYLEKYEEVQQYRKPSGVITIEIDKYTGKLLTPDCLYPFMEAFLTGTEPLEFCTEEDRSRIVDYYYTDDAIDND
jgi:penicillin-binding protein 1A